MRSSRAMTGDMEKEIGDYRVTGVTVTHNGTNSGPGAPAKNLKNYIIRAVDGYGMNRAWGFVATDELDAYNRFRIKMQSQGVVIE